MLSPAVVYFAVFAYIPMAGVVLAFKEYSYELGMFGSPWNGLRNFRYFFASGTAWLVTKNTLLYNLAFLVVGTAVQVSTALLLSEATSRVFRKVAQSILFLPYFISYVLLGAFLYNVFNYEFGLLNGVLEALGARPVDVYNNPAAWKYLMVLFHTWKWVGYGSVIYLGAITSLGQECYEAARIDGATVFQRSRYITLPLLVPTIVVVIMLNLGQVLRGQFELFYQLVGNNGVLFEATEIIDTYVFRALTTNFDIGLGAAAGFYQSLFGLLLVVAANRLVKAYRKDYALF